MADKQENTQNERPFNLKVVLWIKWVRVKQRNTFTLQAINKYGGQGAYDVTKFSFYHNNKDIFNFYAVTVHSFFKQMYESDWSQFSA